MNSKILSLFILTTILVLTMVSALNDFTVSTNTIQLDKAITSITFDIVNPSTIASVVVTIPEFVDINDGEDHTIILSQTITGATPTANPNEYTIAIGTTAIVTVTRIALSPSGTEVKDLAIGTFSQAITLTDGVAANNEVVTLNFYSSFCETGCTGNQLDLDVDIKNKGIGEEDNEWYPFDEIEVEINVDNVFDDDLKDIVVEWGLYNPDKNKFTDIEDEENDFNLKDGKDKTILLNLIADPNDFSEKTDNYIFYVKVYSEDSRNNLNEENSAVEYFEEISIQRDDFMILDSVIFPESIQCGEVFQMTGDVWNIANDQEDSVSIRVYNKELEINEMIDLGDIDALESSDFTFEYNVPKGLAEKLYILELRVIDEDGDTYEADNDDDSVFLRQFKVEGNNCGEATPKPTITAKLDSSTSEAIAGEKVIIKATIKNTGTEETTYDLSVFGNSAWSNLDSIDPQSITLAAGESKDVSIILMIDKDAEGDKELTLKAVDDEQTTEQKIALSIKSKGASSGKVAEHLRTNWFIYVIVLVNLILIIAIISVIKRMVGSNPGM